MHQALMLRLLVGLTSLSVSALVLFYFSVGHQQPQIQHGYQKLSGVDEKPLKTFSLNHSLYQTISKDQYIKVYKTNLLSRLDPISGSKLKYILYYNPFTNCQRTYGRKEFVGCPQDKCYLSDNVSQLKDITRWDAVVFLSLIHI